MQLFCQEEFLRRLEKSKYAENLVLKGGLLLYSLTDFDSRVTADVDFLLRKMPNTPEQLKAILEEIIATETGNDFITFEIKNVTPIAVAKKYAGISASLVAKIKNTKTPFGIDFNGETLTEALKKTFENRGQKFMVEQFEQVMAFGSDDAMWKKWKAFYKKIDTKTDDFSTVLRTIGDFLATPYEAAIEDNRAKEEKQNTGNETVLP